MSALLDLAARVEAATADEQREWLEQAFYALNPAPEGYGEVRDPWVAASNRFHDLMRVEAYESAALTLVPEGWAYAFSSNLIGPGNVAGCQRPKDYAATDATAATPALALTAAFLRAHANTPEASHE